MSVRREISLNATVMVLDGDLDARAVPELRPRLEALLEQTGDVVVDMSAVPFIDSSGIGALVFLFKRLTAAKRSLVLAGVKGQPRDIMTQLHIDRTIPFVDDIRELALQNSPNRGTSGP